MEKIIKIGCVILVIKDSKLLLGKRKNVYGDGFWGFPGGHIKYGEKLIDAARRELEEETGIKDGNLVLAAIVDDPRGGQHYLHVAFKLENFVGEPENKEPDKCERWGFFSLNNLPENIFIGHRKIIDSIREDKLYLY